MPHTTEPAWLAERRIQAVALATAEVEAEASRRLWCASTKRKNREWKASPSAGGGTRAGRRSGGRGGSAV
jgi:hypothetical protein